MESRDPRDMGSPRDTGAPPDWRVELPMVSIRAVPAALGCLKRLLILAVIGGILFAIASAWFFGSVFFAGAGEHDTPREKRAASLRLAGAQQVAPWRSPPRHVTGTGGGALRGEDAGEASSRVAVA